MTLIIKSIKSNFPTIKKILNLKKILKVHKNPKYAKIRFFSKAQDAYNFLKYYYVRQVKQNNS